MVAVHQYPTIEQVMYRAMREAALGEFFSIGFYGGLVGRCAKCDDDAEIGQGIKSFPQERAAIEQFFGRWSVAGRQAADGVEDDHALGCFPVKSKSSERRPQQIARCVAREGNAGSVRTLLPGGEANNGEPRVRIAKGGHGGIPPFRLFDAAGGPCFDEARAKGAVVRWFGGGQGADDIHTSTPNRSG